MIDVAVYNREGKEIETVQVDENVFGGKVRLPLLKQAIVMYHANKRVGTAATKSRGMVKGSTRKVFRQKGTGNARVGNARTGKRVGGGVTFAKVARDFSKDMPKKQRRLAKDSAILNKLKSGSVVVVDELNFDAPKTKDHTLRRPLRDARGPGHEPEKGLSPEPRRNRHDHDASKHQQTNPRTLRPRHGEQATSKGGHRGNQNHTGHEHLHDHSDPQRPHTNPHEGAKKDHRGHQSGRNMDTPDNERKIVGRKDSDQRRLGRHSLD